MYTLYYNIFSQASRRVVALMEQAGLNYELINVDLGAGEHMAPAFLQVNPNHQVPSFKDAETGLHIHESNAILRYLCSKHQLEDWYPEDAVARAEVEQWLDWSQCRFNPAVTAVVLNQVFLGDKGDKAAIEQGLAGLKECWPILDAALQQGSYLAGDKPTIADLAVAACVFQLQLAEIQPATDKTATWFAGMMQLPGFQAALPKPCASDE